MSKENWFKMEIGELIDYLGAQRAKRIELQHQIEAMNSAEANIKNLLIDRLQENKLDKAGGEEYNFSLKRVSVPDTPDDWHKLEQWMKKHDALDLFQRRLSVEACRLRWDQGVKIPGVRKIEKIDVSLTSRKRG